MKKEEKTNNQLAIELCVSKGEIIELKEKLGRQTSQLKELESVLAKKTQKISVLEDKMMSYLQDLRDFKVQDLEGVPSKRLIKLFTYVLFLSGMMQFFIAVFLLGR